MTINFENKCWTSREVSAKLESYKNIEEYPWLAKKFHGNLVGDFILGLLKVCSCGYLTFEKQIPKNYNWNETYALMQKLRQKSSKGFIRDHFLVNKFNEATAALNEHQPTWHLRTMKTIDESICRKAEKLAKKKANEKIALQKAAEEKNLSERRIAAEKQIEILKQQELEAKRLQDQLAEKKRLEDQLAVAEALVKLKAEEAERKLKLEQEKEHRLRAATFVGLPHPVQIGVRVPVGEHPKSNPDKDSFFTTSPFTTFIEAKDTNRASGLITPSFHPKQMPVKTDSPAKNFTRAPLNSHPSVEQVWVPKSESPTKQTETRAPLGSHPTEEKKPEQQSSQPMTQPANSQQRAALGGRAKKR